MFLIDAFLAPMCWCLYWEDWPCVPGPAAAVCRREGHMKCLGGHCGPWTRGRGARGQQTRVPGPRGRVWEVPRPPARVWRSEWGGEPPFGAGLCGLLWVFIDWVQREERPAGIMLTLDSSRRERRYGRKYRHLIGFMFYCRHNFFPHLYFCIAGWGGCWVYHCIKYEVCHGVSEFRRHRQQANNII